MAKNEDRLLRLQRAAADGYFTDAISFWNDAGTSVIFSIRRLSGEVVRLTGKEVDALLLGINLVEGKGRRTAAAAFEAGQGQPSAMQVRPVATFPVDDPQQSAVVRDSMGRIRVEDMDHPGRFGWASLQAEWEVGTDGLA